MTVPNDIIKYIIDNPSDCIDWVHEFFDGKYTIEEVKDYLYTIEPGFPRKGVATLADQFNALETKNTETIRQWYVDTDFYVFDLLPWNASSMFKEKADVILDLIRENNFKTVVDFGGGLGILSLYITLNTDCMVYHVDLPNSVTANFAKFLISKLGAKNIQFLTDEEYFASNLTTDCILATDCFEHIPNMEETFDKLVDHSHMIYHDSTFGSDRWSPQHVYTPHQLEFLNMCAMRNFIPKNDQRLLVRSYLQFDGSGRLMVNFVQ